MDYVDQFFEEQEVGRNGTQARTDHDAIISASCECVGKQRFRRLTRIDVQHRHAVAELFQLGAIRLYIRADFRCRRPGTGDLL